MLLKSLKGVVSKSIPGLHPQIPFSLFSQRSQIINPVHFTFARVLAHDLAVAHPGENLTGALHSNFGRGGCG